MPQDNSNPSQAEKSSKRIVIHSSTLTPSLPHERPAITLIVLMDTVTFITESIDNYNYGEWLSSSLKFQHLLLKHSGSVNGTIMIIDCTSPIKKSCSAAPSGDLINSLMEKPVFLHCSSFALFIPFDGYFLWEGFYVGQQLRCLNGQRLKGKQSVPRWTIINIAAITKCKLNVWLHKHNSIDIFHSEQSSGTDMTCRRTPPPKKRIGAKTWV